MDLAIKMTLSILDDKKATALECFDFSEGMFIHPTVIVASASNPRLLDALIGYLIEMYEREGVTIHHLEGTPESGWILLDVTTFAVHVFLPEIRQYYAVDSLWADKRVERND